MGNEECSHQNLSSAPQFLHALNSGPRESWRVGKPSFINELIDCFCREGVVRVGMDRGAEDPVPFFQVTS